MIVRASSHRACDEIRRRVNNVKARYHQQTLFTDTAKAYFDIPSDARIDNIKGITVPKDQDINNYPECW